MKQTGLRMIFLQSAHLAELDNQKFLSMHLATLTFLLEILVQIYRNCCRKCVKCVKCGPFYTELGIHTSLNKLSNPPKLSTEQSVSDPANPSLSYRASNPSPQLSSQLSHKIHPTLSSTEQKSPHM